MKTVTAAWGPMGGLAIVLTWEEGGTARFPSGDELLLGEQDAD
ncbi:hypothetical protein ACFY6U_26235 [Streptomyces sp. NPDC013157]